MGIAIAHSIYHTMTSLKHIPSVLHSSSGIIFFEPEAICNYAGCKVSV